jgi:hypothetical protein
MATTITPVTHSDTPFSKKYVVATDVNPPGSVTRTLTQLLVDLHDGPLKRALASMGAANLAQFNVDQAYGNAIRIYEEITMPTDASGGRALPSDIHWVSNEDPGVAGLYADLQVGDTRIIEIRLNHTTQA